MPRVRRAVPLVILSLGLFVFLWGGTARAQASRPQSLHVLEIDSDDADEQAEALTGALRSRARSATGWVLLDTTQSLSMLTAALRCPPRPDAACLQRIGDQLKTDKFIWGVISKAGGHQVTADVHLWARGKQDQSVKETYSDNLKDQNDDTLRKIAGRFFDRLTGGPAATLVVHVASAGAPGAPWTGDGVVIADGNQRVPLDHGVATLLTSGGPHVLEVQATGFVAARQNVVAATGTSQDLTVELSPLPLPPPPPQPTSSRKGIILGTLIGGGALLAAGGVLGIVLEEERSRLNTDAQQNYGEQVSKGSLPPGTGEPAKILDPCNPHASQQPNTLSDHMDTQTIGGCNALDTGRTVEIMEIVSLGVGAALAATGIYLLVTDHKDEQAAPPTARLRDVHVFPVFGPHGGSLSLTAVF